MADGLRLNAGSGGDLAATDDVGGQHYARVKWSKGGDGVAQDHYTVYRLLSAASTNQTSVKASAGIVGWVMATNVNSAHRYLKLYNKASAPTVGTDTPAMTLLIPGNTAGAGFILPPGADALFTTGIALALTTGDGADTDVGAVALREIIVHIGYA